MGFINLLDVEKVDFYWYTEFSFINFLCMFCGGAAIYILFHRGVQFTAIDINAFFSPQKPFYMFLIRRGISVRGLGRAGSNIDIIDFIYLNCTLITRRQWHGTAALMALFYFFRCSFEQPQVSCT